MSQKTLQNRATDVWAGVAVILRPRCSRRITIASSGRSAGRPVQHNGQPARWIRGRSVERIHEEAAAVRDVYGNAVGPLGRRTSNSGTGAPGANVGLSSRERPSYVAARQRPVPAPARVVAAVGGNRIRPPRLRIAIEPGDMCSRQEGRPDTRNFRPASRCSGTSQVTFSLRSSPRSSWSSVASVPIS